jgi:hypothetical protein
VEAVRQSDFDDWSAKPAAATSNSAAARKLSATIFAYYLQAMVPI